MSANERGKRLWVTARWVAVPLIALLLGAAAMALLLDSGGVHLPSIASGHDSGSASPPLARVVVRPHTQAKTTRRPVIAQPPAQQSAPAAIKPAPVIVHATTSPTAAGNPGPDASARVSRTSPSPSSGGTRSGGPATTSPPTTTSLPTTTEPQTLAPTEPVTSVSPHGHTHGHGSEVASGQACTTEATFPPGLALGRRSHTPAGQALGHQTHFLPGQGCASRTNVSPGRPVNGNSAGDDDANDQGPADSSQRQDHDHTHASHHESNGRRAHERPQHPIARHAHPDKGRDKPANGHEREHAYTFKGHDRNSSAEHSHEGEPPGGSAYSHGHGHGHGDESEAPGGSAYGHSHGHQGDEQGGTPPGQTDRTQAGSHGRGHDH